MKLRYLLAAAWLAAGALMAQDAAPSAGAAQPAVYTVESGAKVPLSLINSVSTKHSIEGDRVYLQSVFPVLAGGRIVIPVGSSVVGTVTKVTKPGRTKGRGELYIRFDSLILPNGVTRDFHARIGGMDGTNTGTLDRGEGKITSDSNKSGDMQTVGETTLAGTSVGALAGNAAGSGGLGLGVGAGAGLAAGVIAVLATRGPDATLEKGSTVEMVLDRNLTFSDSDVEFGNYQAPRLATPPPAPPAGAKTNPALPVPIRKLP